jgi:alkanesulfonate monooxygenase SsuD/methylene tetrahydromethanopterin reductase-like flavin-dependent oxidoreductase (luciferase family)
MERLTPRQSHAELHDEFIALAAVAGQGGMHALWTGEAANHGLPWAWSSLGTRRGRRWCRKFNKPVENA